MNVRTLGALAVYFILLCASHNGEANAADSHADSKMGGDGGMVTNSIPHTDTNAESARVILMVDNDWLFTLGDPSRAEEPEFDDSAWRTLDVPHDWSIEEAFAQDNPSGPAGGYATCGIGWYRRHFSLPSEFAGKRVFIEFDGVMQNSDVYLNGIHLGTRPNGYVSFRYDVTHAMTTGDTPNVLAVRVDNENQPASRWYAGSGIYRHVRIIATDPVHIGAWSTFVTTPEVSSEAALVNIETTVLNDGDAPEDVSIKVTVIDPNDAVLPKAISTSQTVSVGDAVEFSVDLSVKNPMRWDIDAPHLYTARLAVLVDGVQVDDETVSFGIRTIEFNAETGFFLNGNAVKIKGVCLHHDMSGLGVAVPLRAWQRRLSQIKALGANAVRTSHNPVAPEVLDLMDRMGLLVMDEFFDVWQDAKEPYDLSRAFDAWGEADLTDTVKRDRNHPSIIIYSIGNEIRDSLETRLPIARRLVDICHTLDPTRPVTQGLFRPQINGDYPGNMLDVLDVFGVNYRIDELIEANKYEPRRPIIATEMPSNDNGTKWAKVRDTAAVAGYFIWTGTDYLGEAETWSDDPWPYITYPFGLLDRMGNLTAAGKRHRDFWTSEAGSSQLTDATASAVPAPASSVVLSSDKSELVTDWNDLAYVRADITDGSSNINTTASDLITFAIEGPGTIVAVDSASLYAEAFRSNSRTAYQGSCYAIVRATGAGEITVTGSALGLAPTKVHIIGREGRFKP